MFVMHNARVVVLGTLRQTLLVTSILAALFLTTGALGQGTYGTLPDPINSRDLDRYAERLQLSDQQLLAISDYHAAYLDAFRTLREQEIDRFLGGIREVRGRFDPASFARFEPMLRDLMRLMTRIRALDEQFFNQMQTVLTPEQATQMTRLRQARERARFGSEIARGTSYVNPGIRVDLSELVRELDLSPDEFAAIDPVLIQYESRTTNMVRRLFEVTTRSMLDGLKEVEKLGIDENSMREPAVMMQMFEHAQRIWDEVTEDLLKEAAELASFNRRTCRTLVSLLPPERGQELRRRYLRQAYSQAASIGQEPYQYVREASSLEEISEDQRRTLQALLLSHQQQQNRRIEQIADLLDERRANLSLRQLVQWGEDPSRQRVSDIVEQAEEADKRFVDNLRVQLGPDIMQRLESTARTGETARERRAAAARMSEPDRPRARPGMRWPDRLTSRDLQAIAEELELDDDQMLVLEALHESYESKHQAIQREYAPTMLRMMSSGDGPQSEFNALLDDDDLQQLNGLARDAMAAIREAEASFFDDIRFAVVGEEKADLVERLKGERIRAAALRATPVIEYQAGRGPWTNPGNAEGGVDLQRLVREISGIELSSDVHEILDSYVEESTPLAVTRFNADHRASVVGWQFAIMQQEGSSDRRRWRILGTETRSAMQASSEVNRNLAEINRSTLAAIADNLPRSAARQLEQGYYRAAFPHIYRDPAGTGEVLENAMKLDSLSERQRSRVQDLSLDYRSRFEQICRDMVEAELTITSGGMPRGREGWADREDHRNLMERLRFDRDELSQRTMRQLRAIIGSDAIDQLASLPARQ